MPQKFCVRYKSTQEGTMALYDEYDSHGEAVHAASELKKRFREAGLEMEAKSITIGPN